LREHVERLEALQKYDSQIRELQATLQAIPAKLRATENELARVEGLLNTERAQLAEAQKHNGEQKALLDSEESQATNARHKMSAAKNTREFTAAQREIDLARESVQSRQIEMSRLVDALETKQALLEERATVVKELRDAVQNDGEAAQQKMTEIEAKIASVKAERDKLAGAVRPDLLKRYGAVRIRRGLAMVPVSNGACRGCNMNIPPQLYNIVQGGRSIELCPSCNRILFWEGMLGEGQEQGQGDASTPSS
jgi:hypothetical protein